MQDGGYGLHPELRDRVAERFVRDPSGAPGGSGLGLSIVAGAMHRLGGHVVLEETDGQGQTVRLEL